MMKIAGVPEVTVRAPGKVNLELTVGAPDAAGMHPLATVFQAVSVYEEVTATMTRPGSGISITVAGEDAEKVPTDETNIVYRAALRLAHVSGLIPADAVPDVHIHIEKEIPVGGGMAGGSADAAATLIACNELWRTNLRQDALDDIASELGADVTFCMHGGTAVGSGYGQRLAPVLSEGEYYWLLVLGETPISTADAYRELDAQDREIADPLTVRPELMHALRTGDPEEVGPQLRNDFHDQVVSAQPKIAEAIAFARRNHAAGSIVSGSGPTLAILAKSLRNSRQIRGEFFIHKPEYRIWEVVGPVPGARVVVPH